MTSTDTIAESNVIAFRARKRLYDARRRKLRLRKPAIPKRHNLRGVMIDDFGITYAELITEMRAGRR